MPAATALAIVELRRRRLTQARIAASLGVSGSSVSRVLARAGLSRLSDLDPVEPVQRYEHAAPGDLLHIDTKKLGRIERPSHRVTGNRRDSVEGAGWEFLFVAIDDHARIGFTDMYPDERAASAVQFLRNAHAYYAALGVRLKAVLTDNGGAFHSRDFRRACVELGLKQRFTRAYRPQTNGKAERFIQSALREWAYAFTLPALDRAHEHLGGLDAPLQLAPTPSRHQRCHTHVPTQDVKEQPLDASQLVAALERLSACGSQHDALLRDPSYREGKILCIKANFEKRQVDRHCD